MTLLFEGSEWNFPMLQRMLETVEEIGRTDLGMELYANQVEVITSDQMLDAYASVGMPIMYNHWSFGKRLVRDSSMYKKGHMGLAYEIVINTNPAIAYLMEENSACMQLLVLAHASVGHNFCFANHYMFREWTQADAILDYLSFAKQYIHACEQAHGVQAVEEILDSAHALQAQGVDKYRRARKLNARQEAERQKERLAQWEQNLNPLWYNLDPTSRKKPEPELLLAEPEENLLYFLEKHSPILKPWQRELIRIVRKISQYWYPQQFTKVVNEGIATFTHHHILNKLYDHGAISDSAQLEWMLSHANVVYQPTYDQKHYSGFNPYALGFTILQDVQRMCVNPTEEDRRWFPHLQGQDWRAVIRSASTEYRDDAFIQQWMSPRVARHFKLFSVRDNEDEQQLQVSAVSDEHSFEQLRTDLAQQYDLNHRTPRIQVVKADLQGDRQLVLEHVNVHKHELDDHTELLMKHVHRLWGHAVKLHELNDHKLVSRTWTMTGK